MMKELVKLCGKKNICICPSVKAKYLEFSPVLRDTGKLSYTYKAPVSWGRFLIWLKRNRLAPPTLLPTPKISFLSIQFLQPTCHKPVKCQCRVQHSWSSLSPAAQLLAWPGSVPPHTGSAITLQIHRQFRSIYIMSLKKNQRNAAQI